MAFDLADPFVMAMDPLLLGSGVPSECSDYEDSVSEAFPIHQRNQKSNVMHLRKGIGAAIVEICNCINSELSTSV